VYFELPALSTAFH